MTDDSHPTDKPSRDRRRATGTWDVQAYLVRFPNRRFTPPTDIIELEDQIVILVELAGMRADGFKIALYNQSLIITGTRERPPLPDAAYHQAEIGFGEFRLAVPMPWLVEGDSVNASYRNGFLRIDLPRQEAQRVHIVDVQDDDE